MLNKHRVETSHQGIPNRYKTIVAKQTRCVLVFLYRLQLTGKELGQ